MDDHRMTDPRIKSPEPTLPLPRGPLSQALIDALLDGRAPDIAEISSTEPLGDDDLHLALYVCYELHYRGFSEVDDAMEWDPALLAFRLVMERAFEEALVSAIDVSDEEATDVSSTIRGLASASTMDLANFLGRRAELDQVREFVVHRSAYHLKEADPHTFVIPRLSGGPKAALVEIQADEYGGGRPLRMHATLFAHMMLGLGLDMTYGAYLDEIPGSTLASVNLMSLFGLHRRWRGAAAGHLALFELSSARPNRLYGDGLRRLGFGPEVTAFHDEHVEADSIHDMIATYDLAAALAEAEPDLAPSIVFGARALDLIEGRAAKAMVAAWERGDSSLRGWETVRLED